METMDIVIKSELIILSIIMAMYIIAKRKSKKAERDAWKDKVENIEKETAEAEGEETNMGDT